ncbi:MAG: hypothetical protein ABIF08_04720 [Nanoarchaeota archaeon]
MADILQMLVNVLCPTSSAASSCSSFISRHSTSGDMGAMAYFVLFPTVFIVLFMFILIDFVVQKMGIDSKKEAISLLLSISFYVYIVISGMYPLFLALSEVWYIVIVIMVIFVVILRMFGGFSFGGDNSGGGGKKGGHLHGGGGLSKVISGHLSQKERKNKETLRKTIKGNIKEMHGLVKLLKNKSIANKQGLMSEYRTAKLAALTAISELDDFSEVGGYEISTETTVYKKEIEKMDDEISG